MTNIHDALKQRIAIETGERFLSLLEDNLGLKFMTADGYAAAHFSQELQPSATGHLQHLHILNEVVNAGIEAGLVASMAPTTPKGHHYAKIVTTSFVMGCMRIKSDNWAKAKYSNDFGKLNEALEPINQDLFEAIQVGQLSEKIFLVAAVIENPAAKGTPEIYFEVPYSTLDGYHFRASLDEIRQCLAEGVQEEQLEPLVILKKRLDDAEGESKEA